MDSYVYDEINSIKNLIMMTTSKIRRHAVRKEFVLFVDSSAPAKFFSAALSMLSKNVDSVRVHVVYTDESSAEFLEDFYCFVCPDYKGNKAVLSEVYSRLKVYNSIAEFLSSDVSYRYKEIYVISYLNSLDTAYENIDNQDMYLERLDEVLKYFSKVKEKVSFLHYSIIPELEVLKGDLVSIAEREYEVYASEFSDASPEQFILKAEDVLRQNMADTMFMTALRINNIFGPGIPNKYLDSVIEQAKTGKFVLDTAQTKKHICLNYIRFAACAAFFMIHKGLNGNIYNLRQFSETPFELTLKAYDTLIDHGFGLESVSSGDATEEFTLLSNKKVFALVPKKYLEMDSSECIYRTLISEIGVDFIDRGLNKKYDGKLDEIKKIELEMMKEIKRICEKHNIKYFLVGGSLLGAVRHGGFIPWDDDLDIGMLREDYEKFKLVAPKELDERFSYQSFEHEPSSHYIFDKIRLKDTYFTTKFSDRFQMQNGLFIDILIYDKTAKSLKTQKRHITALRWVTRLISIRWVNVPRKGVAYRFSKIMLPFMRLFPLSFYHKVFNIILKWYGKTDSHYLIDGVGQNIERGAFTDSWFNELIEIPFEDITLPVPAEYDSYLRHWYGDKYMDLPPVSVRNSGHDLTRVDLGRYISGFGYKDGEYHKSNVKGELFDEK